MYSKRNMLTVQNKTASSDHFCFETFCTDLPLEGVRVGGGLNFVYTPPLQTFLKQPTPAAIDADVSRMNIDQYGAPGRMETVSATLTNNGINNITSLQVNLTINGTPVDTRTVAFIGIQRSVNIQFNFTPTGFQLGPNQRVG